MAKADKDPEEYKVRTTFRPDEEITVGPEEYTDLERQGLLVQEERRGTAANREGDK